MAYNMTRKAYISGLLFLLLLVWHIPSSAQTDTLHGYVFTTGVDASKWVTLPSSVVRTYGSLPVGFDFWVRGWPYQTIRYYVHGFGNWSMFSFMTPGSCSRNSLHNVDGLDAASWYGPLLLPTGFEHASPGINYATMGNPGSRVCVMQFDVGSWNTGQVQVHLREDDGSVTYLYRGDDGNEGDSVLVGLSVSGGKYMVVDQRTHTVSDSVTNDIPTVWPGDGRYYTFTPLECGTIVDARVFPVTETSAQVSVTGVTGDCVVEYGPTGFTPGTGDSVTLPAGSDRVVIGGLEVEQEYDIYVSLLCGGSLVNSKLLRYTPSCYMLNGELNRVRYWELGADGVECYYGDFSIPRQTAGAVDLGAENILSRHTIHTDREETDPRTGGLLHTVPAGHCSSVRLGNWLACGEAEEVEYSLVVDTGEFDLLVLNYAIVEEQPNHNPSQQPFFRFGIYDEAGDLVGNCYYGDFVAGDLSGWIEAANNVAWHDWQAVGIDLAPLHGQRVRVRLCNADCSQGGHFGYAYFTLDGGRKRLNAERCGEADSNRLYAPEGFSYRWYNAANPAATLSTAASLEATVEGTYCCEATYNLSGQACGFTLSAYVGARYPVADFVMRQVDAFGSVYQMMNQSYVSHDCLRTSVTNEPCEQYLWDFGDGTTSTSTSPTHRFPVGTHTVTLYAMLAHGQCADTASMTVAVDYHVDTLYDTVCSGTSYLFHDIVCADSGRYDAADEYGGHILFLSYYDRVEIELYDTICTGSSVTFFGTEYSQSGDYLYHSAPGDCDTTAQLHLAVVSEYRREYADTVELGTEYSFFGQRFDCPGLYEVTLVSSGGCDSVLVLRLSSMEQHDTVVCANTFPFSWRGGYFEHAGIDTLHLRNHVGTDSIVFLSVGTIPMPTPQYTPQPYCTDGGGYVVPLADTLCYRWTAQPPDPMLTDAWVCGDSYTAGQTLSPQTTTRYVVWAAYDDGQCPVADTLVLEPVVVAVAQIMVSPEYVWHEDMSFTATDVGSGYDGRTWFVDELPQEERGRQLHYCVPEEADSVVVVMVGYNDYCADTTRTTVTVRQQELWFPNVFTPDEATNNLFRGYGVNVTDYDLKLFTKWGDCFFHTQQLDQGWDGTHAGVKSPEGAYVYLCHYTTPHGERRTVTGTVTLLR